MIHAKDLLVAIVGAERPALEGIARPVEHVPDSLLIDELLEQLRRQREHLAIVVDEHGTAVGIVTLEDVLEEIVGEIEDEFDPEGPPPIAEVDGELRLSGGASVREVADALGVDLDDIHEATLSRLRHRAARPHARGRRAGAARQRRARGDEGQRGARGGAAGGPSPGGPAGPPDDGTGPTAGPS